MEFPLNDTYRIISKKTEFYIFLIAGIVGSKNPTAIWNYHVYEKHINTKAFIVISTPY